MRVPWTTFRGGDSEADEGNVMTTKNTWFADSTLGDRFPAWTRGNAADVFPEPFSPLAQTLVMRRGMCTGLRDAYIRIGVLDYDEFENPASPDLFKRGSPLSGSRLTLCPLLRR